MTTQRTHVTRLALLPILTAAGCAQIIGIEDWKEDGGPGPQEDASADARPPGAPYVTSVSPESNSTGISTTAEIRAVFSEPMDPATINTTTVKVAIGTQALPGTVSYEAATMSAVIRLEHPLTLAARCDVTVDGAITDLEGNAMGESHGWKFTVRDGSWGSPVGIQPQARDAFYPNIAIDSAGNAVAIWQQLKPSSTTSSDMWANRFAARTGKWDTPTKPLSPNNGEVFFVPDVSIRPDGSAIAVWARSLNPGLELLAAPMAADGTWKDGVPINSKWGGYPFEFHISTDENDAIVAWVDGSGAKTNARVKHFKSGAWKEFKDIDFSDAQVRDYSVRTTMDSAGNAVVIWIQYDGAQSIWRSYLRPSGDWATAAVLEDRPGDVHNADVVANSQGDVLTVWTQTDGKAESVWVRRGTTAGAWDAPPDTPLDIGDSPVDGAAVAVSDDGTAMVVWTQPERGVRSVWARRYVPMAGWDKEPTLVEKHDTEVSPLWIQVRLDGAGNAIVAWLEPSGGGVSLWINRFTAAQGWKPEPQLIATGLPAPSSEVPIYELTASKTGFAAIAWEAQKRIMANVFR